MNNVHYWLAGFLVLLSCNASKGEIAEVKFQADGCFGECPVFTMAITSNGAASYAAIRFNKLEGQFRTVIKRPQLHSLMMLLDRARPFGLKDEYAVEITDLPAYTLTIKLKDGKSKTIKDYGPSGPVELKQVYKLLLSLRDTQEWK